MSEARQTKEDCAATQRGTSNNVPKECKDLITLTLEDPVALYTFVLTAATILLFVATCGLWYTAIRQGDDAKEAIATARSSAATAERAAMIAQKSLIAEHRPWIPYPDIKLLSGFDYDIDGAKFVIECVFKNIGKTPACGVYFKIIAILHGNMSAPDAQKNAIELAKNTSVANGVTIFPGEEIIWSETVRITADDITSNRAVYGNFIRPIIIIPIRYTMSLSEDVFVTCVSIDLAKLQNGRLAYMDVNRSYTSDELRLSSPIGNGYAD